MNKYILSLAVIGNTVCHVHYIAAQPSIKISHGSTSVNLVSDQDFVLNVLQHHLKSRSFDQEMTELRGKKTQQTAALLLQGLAQSCSHLGQVIGTDNKQEKQQGVLNILGTVFATAAVLTGSSNNGQSNPASLQNQIQQPESSGEQQTELTSKLIDLTTALLGELDHDSQSSLHKSPQDLPELLRIVHAMPDRESKRVLIGNLLSSVQLAQQFLIELFSTTYNYIYEKSAHIADSIKDLIEKYIFSSTSIADASIIENVVEQPVAIALPLQINLTANNDANSIEKSIDMTSCVAKFNNVMWQALRQSIKPEELTQKDIVMPEYALTSLCKAIIKRYNNQH